MKFFEKLFEMLGGSQKQNRKKEAAEKKKTIESVDKNRAALDRVIDALDSLDFTNTMKPVGAEPCDAEQFSQWEKDNEQYQAWQDKLARYKAFVKGRFLKTLKDASGATLLQTVELDGMTEGLIEWLQEAIRDAKMETADRIILALDYGICVARRDILEQEVPQEAEIREKRLKTLEGHKNMVFTSRQIDTEREQVKECQRQAQSYRQKAKDAQKKLEVLKKENPVAYQHVQNGYGADGIELSGDVKVAVNKIVASMSEYTTAKNLMVSKENDAVDLETHIRELQNAIKIIRENMNAEQKTLPPDILKYLSDTEKVVREAMIARANESEFIDQLMERLWFTYTQMDAAVKRWQLRTISRYNELIAQEKAEKAMEEKLRQEEQQSKQVQTSEEHKQKQTIIAE